MNFDVLLIKKNDYIIKTQKKINNFFKKKTNETQIKIINKKTMTKKFKINQQIIFLIKNIMLNVEKLNY